MRESQAGVYILRCSDDTFYTGWTNDVQKRVAAHGAGRGARYTRARRPVELVYWEPADGRAEAMKRELQIKRMPRAKKEKLAREQSNERDTLQER